MLAQIKNFETKFRNYDKKFSSMLLTIDDDLENVHFLLMLFNILLVENN
jgi:hypothetical protein